MTPYKPPSILFKVNDSTSSLDFFAELLPLRFFELSARETNAYGRAKDAGWRDTTANEQRAFIAVKMFMRLAPLCKLELYWSDKFGMNFVKETFPMYRFKQLQSCWHLSSGESTDPYHKIRPLADVVKEGSCSVYSPGTMVSVDEGIFAFSGRSRLTVYMKDKPHPWGFKAWMAADPSTFFLCDFDLYAPRKKEDGPDEGQTQEVVLKLLDRFRDTGRQAFMDNFYTSIPLLVRLHRIGIDAAGTVRSDRQGLPDEVSGEGKRKAEAKERKKEEKERKQLLRDVASKMKLELKVAKHTSGEGKRSGRKGDTTVKAAATVKPVKARRARRTKEQIAKDKADKASDAEAKKGKAKPRQGDCCMLRSGILTCTSWQDKKRVNMLSTIPNPSLQSSTTRRQKDGEKVSISCPHVVKAYNANMLGVDKHDQLREQYKAKVRTNKWWHSLADDLLATATTNAYILYRNFGTNQLPHFEFLFDLSQRLANRYSAWRHRASQTSAFSPVKCRRSNANARISCETTKVSA
jgi:hypothetical protein